MATKLSSWLEDRDAIVDTGYETDNRFPHTPVMTDYVNNPPHYTQGEIECIDAIRAALGSKGFMAFCRGNSIKYLWRYNHKGGKQDLEKAIWYTEKLIAENENNEK